MSDPSRFFIRSDYVENAAVTTVDRLSGGRYWSKERTRAAAYFQYDVYRHVGVIAERIGARTLVDIGCGAARKLKSLHERFPGLDITGIDQESAIRYCREHFDFGTWIVDDFENPRGVRITENPDIVVCADVIEHVADPDRLLEYIRGIAGQATYIVISTPERERMRGADCAHCPHPQHVREWSAAEFEAFLRSRGFEIHDKKLLPSYRRNLLPAFISYELKRLFRGRPRCDNQMVVLRSNNPKAK